MNAFIKKLEHFAPLSRDERKVLAQACEDVREVPARTELIHEGDQPRDLYIILEGFACRSNIEASGARSIVSYLVPGDIGDQHAFILKAMDHTLSTLSPCRVAKLTQEAFLKLVSPYPKILRALWWSALVDEATSREWIVNVGVRQGPKRVAHLLCELLMRLETVGLVTGRSYHFPLTQIELGETVGLSTVHVNRVIKSLRDRDLIRLDKEKLTIPDVPRLKAFSGFTPGYLHLEKSGTEAGNSLD
jgi:CRP-like cAMP-binding protein